MFAPLGFDNEKFKTELCVKFQELGACPYNTRCRFAHGEAELRSKPKPRQYKTKPCNNFMKTGKCPYGARCNFLHGAQEPVGGVQNPAARGMNMMGGAAPPSMGGAVPVSSGGMTYHQRMRQRQQQGWENFMTGTKHISGCYNVKTVRGFHCERPPVSERFQAWKEMRGEGELANHVLILQDNEQWIIDSEKKRKSEQLLLQQQQQFQQLSALLGRRKGIGLDRKRRERPSDSEETASEDTDDEKRRRHRHRRSKRRRHRRNRRRRNEDGDDSDHGKPSRSPSRESKSASRSRSRSRSPPRRGNEHRDVPQDNGQNVGNAVAPKHADGESLNLRDSVTESDQQFDDKSPSLDDEEDAAGAAANNPQNETLAEMPIPE